MEAGGLFRAEVFEARHEAWLGRVQVVQPLPVRLVVATTLLLMAACAAFVGLGTYARRVHAAGVVLPSAGLFAVASPAQGIVTSANAHEGDRVRRNQLLYVVDTDATAAGGPAQLRILASLRAQRAALLRERALKQSMAAIQKEALTNQLQNLARQHTELGQQIDVQQQEIPILKAKAEQLHHASRRGIVTDDLFQNQLYLYMQGLAQLAQYQQGFLQVEGQMADVSSRLAGFDNATAQALGQLDRSVLELDAQISETEARRAIEVLAPEDGTLTAPRIHAGQQVAAGATLVTLLPASGRLQVQLYVDGAAIGFVRAGQPVLLRYAAFPYQRFGLHRGIVTEVTRAPVGAGGTPPDAPADPGAGPARDEAAQLYRVVVQPARTSIAVQGHTQSLEAGMRVDADIALERRPLYRWLLDPFDRVRRSLRVITGADA